MIWELTNKSISCDTGVNQSFEQEKKWTKLAANFTEQSGEYRLKDEGCSLQEGFDV